MDPHRMPNSETGCEIRLGGECAEFLIIRILGRTHPQMQDFWDGNWVKVRIEVDAGGLSCQMGCDLRAEELETLYRDLSVLVESLDGKVCFTTMEQWLAFDVSGDGRGHIKVEGTLGDLSGDGNSLTFRLSLDQTYLRSTIAQLGHAVSEYPVIGENAH